MNSEWWAFFAATGRQLKVYDGTERTQEIVYDRGTLFAVIGDHVDARGIRGTRGSQTASQSPQAADGPIIPKLENPKSTVVQVDAESERRLWAKLGEVAAGYQNSSLAVRGRYVVFCSSQLAPGGITAARRRGASNHTQGSVVWLDRRSGDILWRHPVELAI